MDNLTHGDVVTITAINVRGKSLAGKMPVKIVKKKDGLYFRPFLLKRPIDIPISVIDYFDPIWMMGESTSNHIEMERYIVSRGMEYYEVMWAAIENQWAETKLPFKSL